MIVGDDQYDIELGASRSGGKRRHCQYQQASAPDRSCGVLKELPCGCASIEILKCFSFSRFLHVCFL